MVLDRDLRSRPVKRHLTAEEKRGVIVAEDQVRVGQSRVGTAQSITGRSGRSAGAPWADSDQVTIVDLGNASTAGSDLNHIDHRNPYRKPASFSRFVDSSYFDLIDTPRFTSTHDCALGRRAAHVERQDVGNT